MRLKTTELPPGDAATARRMFEELIHREAHVLFVVLGDDLAAADLVERADKVAGAPEDLRWVVWMRNSSNHHQQIGELESSDLLDGKDVRAFCTNNDDAICDVILRSEEPVKFRRILQAFAKGEA
jgi:hypothetical protein